MTSHYQEIMEKRDKEIYRDAPCKSIVAENIENVKNNKALTAPLSYLNRSCEFKKIFKAVPKITYYNCIICGKKCKRIGNHGKRLLCDSKKCDKERKRIVNNVYRSRPEIKAKIRKYSRKIARKYRDKRKAYYQRPEVKKRVLEYVNRYNRKHRAEKIEYQKKYYRKHKAKKLEYQKKYYQKRKEKK